MSFLCNSSTAIELILKEALEKEQIEYKEQYLIYTGGKFSTAKYCADFYININNIKLLIECDGYTYHSGNIKVIKDYKRDLWLKQHNYIVLHFSTNEIKYELKYVIDTIKFILKLSNKKPTKKINKEKIDDFKHYKDFYDVTLYLCYYYTYNKLFVTYKFKENYKDIYSEERQKIILNTPEHMVESTAISIALNDIKRKVSIEIKYCGKIFNKRNNIRRQLLLFKKTKEKYNRTYLKYMNIIYYSTKELNFNKQYLIIANLRRHCLAMPRQADKKYEIIKYNDLI